ncbi:pimeloyl-ACP methyl ester carboxylesterase [Azospirillum agricola]|uniref:alpha/beta fold hydrolase n=1 Tax=Azospirillum agricola TaxID=1720247 RepID=UPI001AE32088|nr:alpha/beta hydrolase [Azospirillum agricola]MBP2232127.1 pimeloyl-ACP methyl ester carboxylesterase [Azospirillum agricola]
MAPQGTAADFTDGFIDIAGDRLEYRRIPAAGEGRPTLVFLHEGLGCIAIWKDFPDRLAAATGCGALIYSRRGYGASSAVTPPRPIDYLHREADIVLPALLDAFGLTDTVLVGHSDGASIALLAAAGPLAPRIRLAIAEAPHVFVEDVTIAGIRAAGDLYHNGGLRERLKRLHGDNVDGAFHGWHETWLTPAFRHWNIEDRLPSIRTPLLVIQGVGDEYATAAQYDAIAARSGGPVSVLVLEGCGHTPHRDRAEAVLAAMAEAIGVAARPAA